MVTFKTMNGFSLHPIGIGTWLMGGGMFIDKIPYAVYGTEKKEIEAIQYALSKGQNHIDTAQMYGAGHTEEIVGEAMNGFDRSKIFLASKIWRTHATRSAVVKQVHEMLRRLRTDYLDLLYMHAPWPEVSIEECIQGINDAIDTGMVRAIGVSNFSVDQVSLAISASKHPIRALQNHYNIVSREEYPDALKKLCEQHNIVLVAYKPLERKKVMEVPVLQELAGKYQKTPAQIALHWLIAQHNIVAIPKASSHEHIDENLGAMGFELSEQDIQLLNKLEKA